MKTKNILGLCGAAAVAIATTAHAIPNQDAIRYSTDLGVHWTQVTDTDGDGKIVIASVDQDGFSFTVVSSQTYPKTGSQAKPDMDLNIQGTVANTVASKTLTLWVEFSTIDFGPIPSGHYVTDAGFTNAKGPPPVIGSETTRVGTGAGGNTLFASGVAATTIGGVASGSFESILGAPVAGQTAPYGITLFVAISVTGVTTGDSADHSESISTDTHLTTVPDGGDTMMLLGSAMSVLGGLNMFRKSRKA